MREHRLDIKEDFWWIVGKLGDTGFKYLKHEETKHTPREMTPFSSHAKHFMEVELGFFIKNNPEFTPYLVRATVTPVYLPWGAYDD